MKTIDITDVDRIVRTTTSFRLLSDPTRFKILCLLHRAKNGMCVYEIADEVGISHSATSHQLSKLEDKGIVKCFREGKSACYELTNTAFVKDLVTVMKSFRK
ncbi:MAG: winged helix-turn-helix transcriptional regulator [Parcubacteria group bacterium]|nr:winged helix-turn-helix transcriptional regulator [Parcubacteria group bacterium]